MNSSQRRAVMSLSFIYGNAGPSYTKGNHEFLTRVLEGHENPEHYQPTEHCKECFKKVMDGDYSMLPQKVIDKLKRLEEKEKHWKNVVGEDGE